MTSNRVLHICSLVTTKDDILLLTELLHHCSLCRLPPVYNCWLYVQLSMPLK